MDSLSDSLTAVISNIHAVQARLSVAFDGGQVYIVIRSKWPYGEFRFIARSWSPLPVAVTGLLAEAVPMRVFSSAPGRRLQRVSATIPISLLLEGEGPQKGLDAYTVDISSKGVRVRTVSVLSPGQMVGIVFADDSGHAIPSRVVWAERSSIVASLAGLEFVDTLPA